MSTQEPEFPDCHERVGLKRKLTGPPRLLLGKFKSREKTDFQRRLKRDKCGEDMPENNDQQQQDNKGKDGESSHMTHHSPQKASELEEMETQNDAQGDNLENLETLEKNQGTEENMENKAGVTRSASKTNIRRTFSLLWCSGRKREESDIRQAENRSENTDLQETEKNRNKAHNNTFDSMYDNESCDADNKVVAHRKGKRNFFFMVWPISKRSAVTCNDNLGRQCREQGSSVVFQEKAAPKVSFKKIYRIFPRRKKAHPPVDQLECGASKTTRNETDDQLNPLSIANTEIPSTHDEEHQKEAQEIKDSSPETFTFSAEVSINTDIESGHTDDQQEICPDRDVGKIALSTLKEEKYPVLESRNEILHTSGLLDSCCRGGAFDSGTSSRIAVGDTLALNDADQMESARNVIKCRPVITIERAYSSEEENQEVNVSEEPQFDFLSMNGSWQHLKINSLTNNTLHPSDLSVPPELDHNRCNETLLIQTAISMVQAAIRGAVEQLANEQQQNQISVDRV